MPSTLRFLLDHELSHFVETCATGASYCTKLCAVLFGKQEGGGFEFSQAS